MKKYIIIIALINIHFATTIKADVLMIDRITQSKTFNTPQRGINMSQVIKQFGEPTSKNSAVGNPPIIKWEYENFSVYFENNWVIDSVVHKINQQDKGPKVISN